MYLLGSTYVFYGDIYFLQNFLVKMTVLFLTFFVQKGIEHPPIWKISVVSAVATVVEILGLLFMRSYNLYLIFCHLCLIPAMIGVFFRHSFRAFGKGVLLGYFFVLLVNGVLEALWNTLGEKGWYWAVLVLACGATTLGVFYFSKMKKVSKGIFPVEILQDHYKVCSSALYDSGNRLKDPYTQKGVHIISEELFDLLHIPRGKKVCIPYCSLGQKEGLLDVYYVDCVMILGPSEQIRLEKVPLGVTKEPLFAGKRYKMILNEDVW